MFTLIIACCFLGFFLLYNTSKKAKLSRNGLLEQWAQSNKKPATITGMLLCVCSFTFFIIKDGAAAGSFGSLLLLMAAAGITVVLAPLGYLRLKHVAALVSAAMIIELLMF